MLVLCTGMLCRRWCMCVFMPHKGLSACYMLYADLYMHRCHACLQAGGQAASWLQGDHPSAIQDSQATIRYPTAPFQ